GEVRVLRAVLAELRPLREEVGDAFLARDDQLAALVLLRPRAIEVVGLRGGVVFAARAVRDVVLVADEEEPPERREKRQGDDDDDPTHARLRSSIASPTISP